MYDETTEDTGCACAAHNAREMLEYLSEVLSTVQAYEPGAKANLADVYFTEPVRLRLVRRQLTDGSHVFDIRTDQ
jgi:hypothetical protein